MPSTWWNLNSCNPLILTRLFQPSALMSNSIICTSNLNRMKPKTTILKTIMNRKNSKVSTSIKKHFMLSRKSKIVEGVHLNLIMSVIMLSVQETRAQAQSLKRQKTPTNRTSNWMNSKVHNIINFSRKVKWQSQKKRALKTIKTLTLVSISENSAMCDVFTHNSRN